MSGEKRYVWGSTPGSSVRHRFEVRFQGESLHVSCGTKSAFMQYPGNVNIHSDLPLCKRCLAQAMHPEDMPLDWLVELLSEDYFLEDIDCYLRDDMTGARNEWRDTVNEKHDLRLNDWQFTMLLHRALYRIVLQQWHDACSELSRRADWLKRLAA